MQAILLLVRRIFNPATVFCKIIYRIESIFTTKKEHSEKFSHAEFISESVKFKDFSTEF